MKDNNLQNKPSADKASQYKSFVFTIIAIGSFLTMLYFMIQLKAEGIPLLLCLILHTCSLLLLYRGALIAVDPESWKTESEWMMEDLPPENAEDLSLSEDPSENSIPYKHIYAEVKASLIDNPSNPCGNTEEFSAAEIAEDPPFPQEEANFPHAGTTGKSSAETVAPHYLQSFLSTPQAVVEMDLIAAAKEAMDSLSSFAEAQNIKLYLSTTCDTLMTKADPSSIRILFRNIIDNSIKYMGRPGRMIITISLLGDDIFLILKDTGNGLAEEETRHVFELNFQGSNRVSGNGLGLTQSKMIVEAFGGTIYAKSSPGNGMAIYIQLPVSGDSKNA